MDVRCERCRTEYVFDEAQITLTGLTVQCTRCGHLFKVKKKALIVTMAVKPDELDGPPIPASAVAPNAGARTQVMYPDVAAEIRPAAPLPPPSPASTISATAPAPAVTLPAPPAPAAVPLPERFATGAEGDDLGVDTDVDVAVEPLAREKRSGVGTPLLVALLAVVAAAAGYAGYALAPRIFGERPPAAPLTLEVRPHGAVVPVASTPARAPDPAAAPAPSVTPAPTPPAPVEPAAISAPAPVVPPPAAPPAAAPAEPVPAPGPVTTAAAAPPAPAPQGPKALLARADRMRERGAMAEALELYGRVAADEPDNVAALTGRGLCYLELSRFPPAVASFEAALRASPTHADALLGLAEAYRWQGRDADAIRYYEKYLSEHPDGEEAAVARNALTDLRR